MEYKVVIPSAGLGTRLGKHALNINKALVTVANKPAICHIIDKFPKDVEIVIAVGNRKETLIEVLTLAYPERKLIFVEIDKFEGVGAGLGYTLLQCKEHLMCPFIFCSNDTIVTNNIPIPTTNWIGYADKEMTSQYRGIEVTDNKVNGIFDKGFIVDKMLPYIGLAGIHSYHSFWATLESGQGYGAIEEGESYALRQLLKLNTVYGVRFDWYDIGIPSGLAIANKELLPPNAPNILPKEDEAIWFIGDKVIKYKDDEKFISDRCERSKILGDFVPKIEGQKKHCYSYNKIAGHILSDVINKPLFERFLVEIKPLWQYANINATFSDYYKEKTYERIEQYHNKYGVDNKELINGCLIGPVKDLLDKIDWLAFDRGQPSRIHGDLHFENILVSETGKFVLLDWRQNFAGSKEFGDINYDLAKLWHGLIVPHKSVYNNRFSISKNDNVVNFDIDIPLKIVECEDLYRKYLINTGYNYERIRLLTALIFLNIAALHHDPYSQFLFYLGKYRLHLSL